MVSDLAPSLASQLPQGAVVYTESMTTEKPCGSELAREGASQGNK
jgi:hypothetical protein